ncbi:MAG: TetR/AcrR family transcriptional regulator [Gemmatimonadota bacterium]
MAKRKAERRRRFLDVATRLFGDHGYHNTTVPMIVEAADSSTGSFYFYFENKEDVFVAVLKRAGEELAGRLNEAIDEAVGRVVLGGRGARSGDSLAGVFASRAQTCGRSSIAGG